MQENQSTELATSNAMAAQYGTGLSIAQVKWAGEVFFKSGMFADTSDMSQAMVKIMAGQELGLAPFAAMNGINIIKGRPSMSANLIASAVKKHPKYDYRVLVNSDVHCEIEWYEVIDGKREKVGKNAFTNEMAKNAGLHGDNWNKYPAAMLFARAISAGYKMYAPDVFMVSVYTEDEIISDGYIPNAAPTVKAIAPAPVQRLDTIPGDQADDEPFTEQPQMMSVHNTAVAEPETLSNDDEVYDEESERPLAKGVKKVLVDAAFKKAAKKSLDELKLDATARMRLLKDATGKITMDNLTDDQWRNFSAAIDDKMIEMADNITAAETPVEKEDGGENATDNANDQEGAES